MKKIIVKILYFTVPFFLLFGFNRIFFKSNDGDLARLGYFYNNPSPKQNVIQSFSLKRKYNLLSEVNLNEPQHFKVLNIGDSFSEQDSLSYQNFLAHQAISVLHFDRYLASENNLQQLIDLINGDFFEKNKVEYVVLQCAERMFVSRAFNINFKSKCDTKDLIKLKTLKTKPTEKYQMKFFSDAMFKIPLNNLQYYFTDKPIYSSTYKTASNNTALFSNNPNNILFFQDDIDYLKFNNNDKNVILANQNINQINQLLQQKNIQLILLIAPDKYQIYHDYILDKTPYPKPSFFSNFNPLPKNYRYVPSEKRLKEMVKTHKDVYFYDDSHWSPIGAKVMAEELGFLLR